MSAKQSSAARKNIKKAKIRAHRVRQKRRRGRSAQPFKGLTLLSMASAK
jgi:hypothetical protein